MALYSRSLLSALIAPLIRIDVLKHCPMRWPGNQGHAIGKFLSSAAARWNGQPIQAVVAISEFVPSNRPSSWLPI